MHAKIHEPGEGFVLSKSIFFCLHVEKEKLDFQEAMNTYACR